MATNIFSCSDSFTRPADTTAYAQGDLVANSTTAGSVTPMEFFVGRSGIKIHTITATKSGTTATASNFYLALFTSAPTFANGDNGAFSINLSDNVFYGKVAPSRTSFIMDAGTDGSYSVVNNIDTVIDAKSTGILYGVLIADAAYTPASAEVFTVKLSFEKL